ncbi:MAG: hypothetical protein C0417_08090 [Chlorobiaceae bacterium]|nr:hypothetical protein [Chlorobiaceae bacterium]
MNHLTSELIQEYLDGLVTTDIRNSIEIHLDDCNICRDKMKSYQAIDSALKTMPCENANPYFTQRVMERLGIKESPSIIWSIFKNLAPLLGLIIIVGVIYAALRFTGKLEGSGVGDTVTATQSVYNTAASGISSGISSFTGWMKNIFPFLYTKNSYGIVVYLLILFIIVALLDKFIFMPIVKRKM